MKDKENVMYVHFNIKTVYGYIFYGMCRLKKRRLYWEYWFKWESQRLKMEVWNCMKSWGRIEAADTDDLTCLLNHTEKQSGKRNVSSFFFFTCFLRVIYLLPWSRPVTLSSKQDSVLCHCLWCYLRKHNIDLSIGMKCPFFFNNLPIELAAGRWTNDHIHK